MTDHRSTADRPMSAEPPPPDFDPFQASTHDLHRYRLPLRPDRHRQPGLAALWEDKAERYRLFEGLQVGLEPSGPADGGLSAQPSGPGSAARLFPRETCGYELRSVGAPFTSLFITWTVPSLRFVTGGAGPNLFRTFVGLGFLDVHVELTVDAAQEVTSRVTVRGAGQVDLPVRPGDVLSAALCLQNGGETSRASYLLANETSTQRTSLGLDLSVPPATVVNAGVSRGYAQAPQNPLTRFGSVFFDDISAYTTDGFRSLLSGEAVTMVGADGRAIARPHRINDFAFKAEYAVS